MGAPTGRPTEPLVCPSCASTYPLEERFCPSCKMPLVYASAIGQSKRLTERHERARKIKPQLAEGELVRVAWARNQAEAEFIQGLLLEEGVPSLLRRSAGFDVPDFLAAGPRDVLVPQTGAATAREVLMEAEIITGDAARERVVAPTRLLAGILVMLALGALIVWLAIDVLK
jgi:uncharacterized protein YbaR (Trm112 family)